MKPDERFQRSLMADKKWNLSHQAAGRRGAIVDCFTLRRRWSCSHMNIAAWKTVFAAIFEKEQMVEAPFLPSAGCGEDAGICRWSPREEPDERRQLIQDKLITACLQFSVAHNENSSAAHREAVISLTNNLHQATTTTPEWEELFSHNLLFNLNLNLMLTY